MKILTYGSFGGFQPAAVIDFANRHDCDCRSDPQLINYVMSFKDDGTSAAATDPNKLRYCRTDEGKGGIRVHRFAGWSSPDGPDKGFLTSVCVNEYDEARLKVRIAAHNGAETLEPLPEFVPYPHIPGLYVEAGWN